MRRLNLILWTSTGKLQCNNSQRKETCGTILKVKGIKQSSRTAIDSWTKFRKVCQSISKQRENSSPGFSSFLMSSCCKFWPRQRSQKPSKGTLTSVLKELVNLSWRMELYLVWFPWKRKELSSAKKSMSMKDKRKEMLRGGCLKLKGSWLLPWRKSPKMLSKTRHRESSGWKCGQLKLFLVLIWLGGQMEPKKPSVMGMCLPIFNSWNQKSRILSSWWEQTFLNLTD